MNVPNRKDTTSMSTRYRHPWARDERGESVVAVLVGALIGTMIIGGFFAFWIRTNDTGTQVADHAKQQSAGVESLNRIGRDVRSANRVLEAKPGELVLQKRNSDRTLTRTYYRVAGTGNDGTIESWVQPAVPEGTAYSADDPWGAPASALKTEARKINTTNTKFGYKDKAGATTTNEADVKLVNIDFEALAGTTGKVTLKSAAALDVAEGDTVTPGNRTDPKANPDAITVRKNGAAVTVNALANDECPAGGAVCTSGTASVLAATSPATGITVTPNGVGGFAIQVVGTATTGYTGAESTATTETFEYVLTDNEGDTDGAIITITVRPEPKAPDAVDDTQNIPVGSARWTVLLTNDRCDNGFGALTLGCVGADPVITRLTNPPAGVTTNVDAQNRFVTSSISDTYAGPRTFTVDYRLIDRNEPTLDGNDTNTLPGDDATVTFNVGPGAVDDIATVQAEAATGTIDIYGNDNRGAGTTLTWVTATPSWITKNAAGNVLTLNPDDGNLGVHSFTYRLTDTLGQTDTAVVTITVTAGPPPVAIDGGAWSFADTNGNGLTDMATNRIAMSGGNGAYKLFRASTYDASWRPTGTIVKVCDSTDAITTNDCANPMSDNVALSSGYSYLAYDSRTADPVAAGPTCASGSSTCSRKRVAADYVVTFPQDPRLLGFGSDADNNGVPERQSVNTLMWVKKDAREQVGIRQRIMTPNWGYLEMRAANTTDLGIRQLDTTDCAGLWTNCHRIGGQANGSERLYQAYAVTPVEAAGTDATTACDLYPGSPVGSRTYGGVAHCPSPAALQVGETGLVYANAVTGNGNAAGTDTDGNADTLGREMVRLYQAPGAPSDFIIGDRSSGDPVNGYGYVSEACPDVTRGDNNRVYSCTTNLAMAAFTVEGSKGSDNSNGGGYCGVAGDPGNCHGKFNRSNDGWTSGQVEASAGCGGWCSARTDSQWLGALAYGGTDNWRGQNCNAGGCSQNAHTPVRMYASRPGINAGYAVNAPDQDYKWGHPQVGNDCWDYNPNAAPWYCTDNVLQSMTYTWPNSAGADHYSVGGYQDIPWGWNMAGGACYNYGLASGIRPEDAGNSSGWPTNSDGRVPIDWHRPSDPNAGYKYCIGQGGSGLGQLGTSFTASLPVSTLFTLVADPIAANGLRQRNQLTYWTPGPRTSFMGTSNSCNSNYSLDWWRLAFAYRSSGQVLDGADNAWRTANYWERLGHIGVDNGDFFRGRSAPATNMYWPAGWHNDRFQTRLQATDDSGFVGATRTSESGVAFGIGSAGVNSGGMVKGFMFDNDDSTNIYAHHPNLIAMMAIRSYAGPDGYRAPFVQGGNSWSARTMVGNKWGSGQPECNPQWGFNTMGSPTPNWRFFTSGNEMTRLHWKVVRSDGWARYSPKGSPVNGATGHLDFGNPYL